MDRESNRHIDNVLEVVSAAAEAPPEDIVRKSWIRSANSHCIDPESPRRPRILTTNELRDFREAESDLIEVAQVELDRLYRLVRPAKYVILLTDRSGLVIDHRGEDAEAAQFQRWGVWRGGVWSEEAEGTNGIGTAIAEARPVTVHRTEHFRARHITLSCSGAPIHDPNGDMIGVLDVSSIDPQLSEHSHALTGALTIATARAIEERLFRKRFRHAWIIAARPPNAPGAGVLIAVDRDLQIVGADRCACSTFAELGRESHNDGLGLWSVFERDDAMFRHPSRGDAETQLAPRGGVDPWLAIVSPPELTRSHVGSTGEDLRLAPRLDALAMRRARRSPSRGGLTPATLRRVRDYVEAHLDEPIDIDSLATAAGLSPFHFARGFKTSEGATPHQYVLERRVAKARELLANTRQPLSEIAQAAGFADQSHLGRRFRQIVGLPPGQYRKLQAA